MSKCEKIKKGRETFKLQKKDPLKFPLPTLQVIIINFRSKAIFFITLPVEDFCRLCRPFPFTNMMIIDYHNFTCLSHRCAITVCSITITKTNIFISI